MIAIFLESVTTSIKRQFQDFLKDLLSERVISIFGLDISLYLLIGIILITLYVRKERQVLSRIVREVPYVYGVLTFHYKITETDYFSVRLKDISSNHCFPLDFRTPLFNRSILIHKETIREFRDATEPFRWGVRQLFKERKKYSKYATKIGDLAKRLNNELVKLKPEDFACENSYKEYVFKLATLTVIFDKMQVGSDAGTYKEFSNQDVIDKLYASEDFPIIRFILMQDYFKDYGETPYFHDNDTIYLIYPTGRVKNKGTFAMCIMNASIQHSHDELQQIRKIHRMLWQLKVSTVFKELINKGKEIMNWLK